jgi:hypothetical protein
MYQLYMCKNMYITDQLYKCKNMYVYNVLVERMYVRTCI